MEAARATISSLVITLAAESQIQETACGDLARRADLQLGARQGVWVAAVLQSERPKEAVGAIEQVDGVEHVEVVFVELEQNV